MENMSFVLQNMRVLLFLMCAFHYCACKNDYFNEVPKDNQPEKQAKTLEHDVLDQVIRKKQQKHKKQISGNSFVSSLNPLSNIVRYDGKLRCSGCELTVKVINQMLANSKPNQAGKFVDYVLKEVCDKKRFTISEYKADHMVKTCKFMTDYHGDELRQELIKHYSKPKKSTYIELSQQICLNIMRLCPGEAYRMPDHHDPSLGHFSHFLKVSGMDAKIVKPVIAGASHDEL